jgi:hypothetical protein
MGKEKRKNNKQYLLSLAPHRRLRFFYRREEVAGRAHRRGISRNDFLIHLLLFSIFNAAFYILFLINNGAKQKSKAWQEGKFL